MGNAQEKISHLRMLIGDQESFSKKEFFLSSSVLVRIPKGCLVEITGNAKAEWIVRFLKENENVRVFWCEEKQSIFPTAMSQRGVNLERIVFGVFKDNLFSALRKIIQSQVFEVIVGPSSFKEIKLLKALQLFTEKANSTLFLLAQTHQNAWPISVQVEVNRGAAKQSFEVVIQKNRYEASGCV